MLHSIQTLKGLSIGATDDQIGNIDEAYFDDSRWAIRYLVTDTGGWLSGRKVLVSPRSIQRIEWPHRVVHVNLNRQQVENSPPIDTDKPVSRQHEIEYSDYYGYAPYWMGADLWPVALPRDELARLEHERTYGDPHLRSSREVVGYYVAATDGDIGHIDDILFDDVDWALRYFVIDTRNWWPGKQVLVATSWIDTIDWAEQKVSISLSRAEIESSPEYHPGRVLGRDYEEALHRHYRKPTYWNTRDEPFPPIPGP